MRDHFRHPVEGHAVDHKSYIKVSRSHIEYDSLAFSQKADQTDSKMKFVVSPSAKSFDPKSVI